MNKFQNIKSKFINLDLDNIDTDMIIPAQYLTSTSKTGYLEGLFKRLREADKDFPFNKFKPFNKSSIDERSILITGDNFGCGSSREHAVWALSEYGIRAIIAKSYSDIFYNNALKNGLLVIKLEEGEINNLRSNYLEKELIINLEKEIISSDNFSTSFTIDPFRKHCLLNGEEDLDYLLSKKEEITNFFSNKKDKNFFSNV